MDAAEMAEAPAPRSTLTQSNPRSSETPNFVVPDFFFLNLLLLLSLNNLGTFLK